MLEFFAYLDEELPSLIDKWRSKRAPQLNATASSTAVILTW